MGSSMVSEGQVQQSQCAHCQKRLSLCMCAHSAPLPTKTHVLILQHPQEPDKELGTAIILHKALTNSTLRVGLSWRNLTSALGRKPSPDSREPALDPKRWGVLFLGTKERSHEHTDSTIKGATPSSSPVLEGIVVLDGNWRQAKAMWWRNPWLLKLRRIVLTPATPSLYGDLRREPRRESLSTIEAAALALEQVEGNIEVATQLRRQFADFLSKCRATKLFTTTKAVRTGGARRSSRHRRGKRSSTV